jgi:hypothetical protein
MDNMVDKIPAVIEIKPVAPKVIPITYDNKILLQRLNRRLLAEARLHTGILAAIINSKRVEITANSIANVNIVSPLLFLMYLFFNIAKVRC